MGDSRGYSSAFIPVSNGSITGKASPCLMFCMEMPKILMYCYLAVVT